MNAGPSNAIASLAECLAAAPEHLYAHLRLGQLCEESGRRNEARRFYEEAARIEDSLREGRQDGGPSLARRYLAGLPYEE